ncbi:MAG: hypothetical protein HXY51_11295 [Nitrospirae bacterium]|nr:hypothetical protein [Nitrospirota bacterium]
MKIILLLAFCLLPFESIDLLFVCNTVHHPEERSKYFRDLRSSLRPGARIVITFIPMNDPANWDFRSAISSRETQSSGRWHNLTGVGHAFA